MYFFESGDRVTIMAFEFDPPDCRLVFRSPVLDLTEEEATELLRRTPLVAVCHIKDRPFKGIFWCFLITHRKPMKRAKNNALVGYGINPISICRRHNACELKCRETKAAAPNWELEMVVGPLFSPEEAHALCKDWVENTRGIDSKIKKGTLLSKRQYLRVYKKTRNSNEAIVGYLKKKNLKNYLNFFVRIKNLHSDACETK